MPGREALLLAYSAGRAPSALSELPLTDGSLALKIDQPPMLPARPDLQLVAGIIDSQSQAKLASAEAIPMLNDERRKAAQEAAGLLARNRQRLYNGDSENVPRPIDALGTARQVVEVKRQYGVKSSEYREIFTGLVLDSERLLAEAFSKNTAEYFGKVMQTRDVGSGHYFAHGLSIHRMVTNGLTPLAEAEETDRRINEYVEETGTYEVIGQAIDKIGVRGFVADLVPYVPSAKAEMETDPELLAIRGLSVDVTSISECTDYALRDFKVNPKGSHGGYAPGVDKLMIRRLHFSSDSGDRYEEQVAVPGIFIDEEVRRGVLAEEQAVIQSVTASKTERHGTQYVGVNSGPAIGLVKKLDAAASRKHGKNIFMGEEVPEDHPKDYQAFMKQAEIRRRKLAPKPTELANYLVSLEEKGIDSRHAEARVDQFLKKTLLEVASQNPDLAEAMFDKATADGFREVARLKASGRHSEARSLQTEVEENAPEVSYCSGGSCGLEKVLPNSPEARRARELGLTTGELLHDTERECPNCHKKEVYYDEAGSKACLNPDCEKTEIKL